MANPLPPQRLVDVLIAEGCTVVGLPGWESHNRNAATGKGFAPNGIVNHHTGSDTSNERAYAGGILWSGRPGLPGPLCTAGLGPSGTIYMVGWGRANHAGIGDAAIRALVIDEPEWLLDREARPSVQNLDGNSYFYGIEIMYSGGHTMTAAQYKAAVRFNAAICRAHGWTSRSCIAHREWSTQKPDPGFVSLAAFRRDVAAALALPAGQWGSNTPTPTPPTPKPPEEPVTDYIAASSIPSEGGKVFLLVPGKAPLWLSPAQWQHVCRVTPYWATLPGSPFYESQIMEINAMIQPDAAVARAMGALATPEPESGGVTLANYRQLADEALAPACAEGETA